MWQLLQMAIVTGAVCIVLFAFIKYVQSIKRVVVYNAKMTATRPLSEGDPVWLRGPIGSMTDTSEQARSRLCSIHAVNPDGTADVYVSLTDDQQPTLVAKVFFSIAPSDLSTEPVVTSKALS